MSKNKDIFVVNAQDIDFWLVQTQDGKFSLHAEYEDFAKNMKQLGYEDNVIETLVSRELLVITDKLYRNTDHPIKLKQEEYEKKKGHVISVTLEGSRSASDLKDRIIGLITEPQMEASQKITTPSGPLSSQPSYIAKLTSKNCRDGLQKSDWTATLVKGWTNGKPPHDPSLN